MEQPGCAAGVAAEALLALSRSFEERDLEALLAGFSGQPSATYAGSELGELATGGPALRRLLGVVLAREARYCFTFETVQAQETNGLIWVLADGTGQETAPGGVVTPFPYRASGLLLHERGRWRWVLLACAEPTPPLGGI